MPGFSTPLLPRYGEPLQKSPSWRFKPFGQLTGTQSLGTNPIGYLQLGDTSATDSFVTVFDDVRLLVPAYA
jgi:hypothetical protein